MSKDLSVKKVRELGTKLSYQKNPVTLEADFVPFAPYHLIAIVSKGSSETAIDVTEKEAFNKLPISDGSYTIVMYEVDTEVLGSCLADV